MPELPEVQTIAADLDEAARGLSIVEAAVARPQITPGGAEAFSRLVSGTTVGEVRRLGKMVHFLLSSDRGPAHFLAHLKMTGQFRLGPWPEPGAWPKHVHAALRLAGAANGEAAPALLYHDVRRFGRLYAFTQPDFEEFRAKLNQGPDPLTLAPEEFHRRLTARRGRLKALLLDQRVVAGFGNIYADESLFAARLSPLAPAAALSREESGRLLGEARRIFRAAIAARGSTISDYQGLKGGGSYQESHLVYGRAGRPCPVCGTALKKITAAGRGTHFCPACQALPGAE